MPGRPDERVDVGRGWIEIHERLNGRQIADAGESARFVRRHAESGATEQMFV
jgi:hypothetical protein